ncbi:DgyrCDS4949 [Dimorphilus gyrociliatus]|uniref:DgyrCDS4949 n=1 Tax=Dimorphilus gyrociliatus TaxID=2664684 RepID=A0A7I8VII5_9ANNE|nr:DgyrCDS4949 [Dimorphilus gyrociliatus]
MSDHERDNNANENEEDMGELVEVISLDEEGEGAELAQDLADFEMNDEDEASGGELVVDDAILVFEKHKGSVFSVDVNPSSTYVVTGGEDDMAYVWNIENSEIILECNGFKDSVCNSSFNHDGQLLAAADMSGLVQVYKMTDKSIAWSGECSDIEWLKWHHSGNVIAVGTTDGSIWLWKVPSGDCKILSNATTSGCGTFLPDGKRLVSGYSDGSVKIWNLKDAVVQFNIPSASGAPTSNIACHPNKPLVIAGFENATAVLINAQNGKVIANFDCSSNQKGEDENKEEVVEGLSFCTSQNLAVTSTLAGLIHIWDLSSLNIRHIIQVGVSRIIYNISRLGYLGYYCYYNRTILNLNSSK